MIGKSAVDNKSRGSCPVVANTTISVVAVVATVVATVDATVDTTASTGSIPRWL